MTFEHYNFSTNKNSMKGKLSRHNSIGGKEVNESLHKEMHSLISNMHSLLNKLDQGKDSPILVKDDYCNAQTDIHQSLQHLNRRLSQI